MSTYTYDQRQSAMKDNGFTPVDPLTIIGDKTLCHNPDGFIVLLDVPSLMRRGSKPEVFSKANPFTLENIKILLNKKGSNTILLSTENHGSSAKYLFRCECGKEFLQSLCTLRGRNPNGLCPHCSKTRGWDDRRVPLEAIQDAFKKRGYIIQGDIPEGCGVTQERISYICSKHIDKGVQYIRPDSLMNRGDGCMYCGIKKRGLKHRHSEDYLMKITEMAGFSYVGVEYPFTYTTTRAKILFVCSKHSDYGVQMLSVTNMKRSNGRCKYCVNRFISLDGFMEQLNIVSPSIRARDYSTVSERMIAICGECGREWSSTGTNLLQGKGCPSCCSSRFENTVDDILKSMFVNIVRQKKFVKCRDQNPLPFDFYLPDLKIAIEADGEGHYMPINFGGCSDESAIKAYESTVKHDAIKTEYCITHGIKLIRIPYWERANIKEYIINELNKLRVKDISA